MTPPAALRDRGFVLVNALVLVAALAATATLLLSRAERGRAQLEAAQLADQLTLALDAFGALALTRLAQDRGNSDHGTEGWAQPRQTLPLARGEVAGEIQDLQGRFNINWLSSPDNRLAQEAFARLLAQLGLSPELGTEIRRFVTPGALRDAPAGALRWQEGRALALDPVGGPLLSADQLADLPGLSPRAYARLRGLITALPGDSRLNVNTAAPEVLAAFLPELPASALTRLIRNRDRSPFVSVEAFLIAARLHQEEQAEAGRPPPPTGEGEEGSEQAPRLGPDHLTIRSRWFRVTSQAQLPPLAARRVTILRRNGPGQRPDLIWQVTLRP